MLVRFEILNVSVVCHLMFFCCLDVKEPVLAASQYVAKINFLLEV